MVGERTGPEGERGGKNKGKRVGAKGPKAQDRNLLKLRSLDSSCPFFPKRY